ncbi:MAG: hypothetical protein ABI675_30435 [Chitinophagaceae bacterium]
MLQREEYLILIENIRNTEKIALDDYITKHLMPLKNENDSFVEILYKDIYYILKDVDQPGDNELVIEDGDFALEDDDIKLTGYQTRLHDILIWLHTEMIEKIAKSIKNPNNIINKLEKFKCFLEKESYTPEYKQRLDKIKRSIKAERKQNYGNSKGAKLSRIFDLDNFSLKPNIGGMGIDVNKIIEKLKK